MQKLGSSIRTEMMASKNDTDTIVKSDTNAKVTALQRKVGVIPKQISVISNYFAHISTAIDGVLTNQHQLFHIIRGSDEESASFINEMRDMMRTQEAATVQEPKRHGRPPKVQNASTNHSPTMATILVTPFTPFHVNSEQYRQFINLLNL